MKIAVWKTNHLIADTVADAVYDGLFRIIGTYNYGHSGCPTGVLFADANSLNESPHEFISHFDLHIGYGILRGMDKVFRACQKAGKPFLLVDRGYWKPGHYEGFYRISLNGTQQTFGFDRLEPDYERWDALGLEILPEVSGIKGKLLCCPPTDYVREFFGYKEYYIPEWVNIRQKGSTIPLQDDLDSCIGVHTFNSSVGWEALRQGIPVVSDPVHSIVGSFQKTLDRPLHMDYEARRRLFGIMAGLQMTLSEMKEGKLWHLLQRLLALL